MCWPHRIRPSQETSTVRVQVTRARSMRVIARPHASIQALSQSRSPRVTRPLSQRWLHHHHHHRACTRGQQSPTRIPAITPTLGWRPAASRVRHINTHEPTIYALSSGAGRAAIAVIRVSGPACLDIYRALCPGKPVPKPRVASVRTLYKPGDGPEGAKVLDSNALLLYFPAPRSATGEDVLELHIHGGPAVVKAVLTAIGTSTSHGRGGVRYAEPGEFTRRAFINNRIDLTQVEALGDVLAAETEQQRQLSVRGTRSNLSRLYEGWRTNLLHARGELEALIDFSEDQHFDESPAELCMSVAAQVRVLLRILRIHSQNAVRGELLRNGISISLLGAPNAGKSSLLNRIVGREAAIVSHEAGTTRDVVEVGLDIRGYFCRLGDTAGLRKALSASAGAQPLQGTGEGGRSGGVISQIEEEGMRRAKARARDSDVVIVVLCFEPGEYTATDLRGDNVTLRIDPEVQETGAGLVRDKGNVIVVINKADLALQAHVRDTAVQQALSAFPGLGKDAVHLISCTVATGQDAGSPIPRNRRDPATPEPADPPVRRGTAAATQSHDPGGIQAMLRGLTRRFAQLTAALTDEQSDADSAGQKERTTREGIRGDDLLVPATAGAAAPSTTTMDLECPAPTNPAAATATADSAPVASNPSSELAAATSTFWDESLAASVRHRELLDACILHLTAFLSAVEVRNSPPLPLSGYPAATDTMSPTRAEASSSVAAANHFPAAKQPYAEVPVPDRPRAADHLALDGNDAHPDIVVAAEHLRAAADSLARITGRGDVGDVEEVLGVVFENFCVGK